MLEDDPLEVLADSEDEEDNDSLLQELLDCELVEELDSEIDEDDCEEVEEEEELLSSSMDRIESLFLSVVGPGN